MSEPTNKPWSHPRRVKLTIPGTPGPITNPHVRPEPDFILTLEVEEKNKVPFLNLLTQFFYFCSSKGAAVKTSRTVIDTESKEPSQLSIEVVGFRDLVGAELQRLGPEFLKLSTRIVAA